MDDNANEVPAEEPIVAPATVEEPTAAPEETVAPPEEPTEAPAKTFTQEELDAILEKRLAQERRRAAREQAASVAPPEQYDGDGFLRTPEEIIADHEAKKQQEVIQSQYAEREEAVMEKYDDFQQVAYNPRLSITTDMALAIQADPNGPEILYHLGSNPREAARIAQLIPVQRAMEIGKIAALVAANPPAKKTTGAPPPISPVTPSSNGSPVFDTTDPRSIGTMTTSEWIAADRARQRAKLERQH